MMVLKRERALAKQKAEWKAEQKEKQKEKQKLWLR